MSTNTEQKIEKLTPEQEAKIPDYVERFRAIGLSTRPTDRAKAEEALREMYQYQNLPAPRFVWAEDPFSGAILAAKMSAYTVPEELKDAPLDVLMAEVRKVKVTPSDVQAQASKANFGSFEAQWVVAHSFICNELPVKHDGLIHKVEKTIEECGVYWTFSEPAIALVTPKPSEIHVDEERRLHSTTGMALKYANGEGFYAYKGQRKDNLMEVALAEKMKDSDQEVESED